MDGDVVYKLRRKFCVIFCLWLKTKIFKFLAFGSVLLMFSYHVYFNAQEYQRNRKVFEASTSDHPPAQFPPFTLCVYPLFNPLHLVSLGLNISVDTIEDLEDSINDLNGVERDVPGSELVEKAAWKVEDFVEKVLLGDAVLESYTGNVSSKMWRRSFTPLGPCLTFIAPLDASLRHHELTIKLRDKPVGLQQCSWVQEKGNKNYSERETCLSVSKNCNTSCVWELYIQQMFHILYAFVSSTYYTYDTDKRALDLRVFSGQTYEFFPYHIFDSSFNSNEYTEKCFLKIFSEEVRVKSDCLLMNSRDILKQQMKKLCITGQQTFIVNSAYIGLNERERTRIEYLCKPKKEEYRWKLKGHQRKKEKQSITLRLASQSTAIFHKKPTYSLSEFLEDIGGSLGLFLGISLLDIWLLFPKYILSVQGGSKEVTFLGPCVFGNTKHFGPKHLTELYKFSGAIILAVPFCMQCWITAEAYVYDSRIPSVSIERWYGDIELHKVNLTLKEAFLVSVASRPFGCQLLKLPDSEKCLFHCLLELMPNLPLSYNYFEDLPLCHHLNMKFPRIRYYLQRDIIDLGSSVSRIDFCRTKCESSSSSMYPVRHVIPTVSYDSSSSFMDVACSFGGVVGLYFGFSMQLPLHFLSRGRLHSIIRSWNSLVTAVWFVVTFFICLALCYSPVKTFFYNHSVYSETSSLLLHSKHLPTITICIWPPFNLKKLLTLLNSDASYEDIMRSGPHSKNFSIAKITNISGIQRIYSPKHLWMNIAWSMEDLEIESVEPVASFNRSIFGRCSFIDWKALSEDDFDSNHYNLYWSLDPSLKDIVHAFYAFIHDQNDFLPAVQDVLGQTKGFSMTLKRVSRWTGRYGVHLNSGECSLKCLDNLLVDKLGCLLPWVDWRSDLNQCNFTQFMEFLTSLWFLEPGFDSVYKSFLGSDRISFCKETCQPMRESYYSINFDEFLGSKAGNAFALLLLPISPEKAGEFDIDLKIETSSFETVREVDGYPVSQFVSDLGGIIGLTMGISLLSIVLTVVK